MINLPLNGLTITTVRFSNSYLHYLKENTMTLLYVELMQLVTPIFSQSVSYLTLSTGTEWCQIGVVLETMHSSGNTRLVVYQEIDSSS